jgi:hypothetical protein
MHQLSSHAGPHGGTKSTLLFYSGARNMSDNKREAGKKGASDATSESEKALQEELRREAAEGKGSVGDAAKNSNLSGSSTWETLPEEKGEDKKGKK